MRLYLCGVINSISTAMINYSIVMRPVNANLFEINQAMEGCTHSHPSGMQNLYSNIRT